MEVDGQVLMLDTLALLVEGTAVVVAAVAVAVATQENEPDLHWLL